MGSIFSLRHSLMSQMMLWKPRCDLYNISEDLQKKLEKTICLVFFFPLYEGAEDEGVALVSTNFHILTYRLPLLENYFLS